jgi:hypothetical protein
MKSPQLEILLFTNTRFSSKQFCGRCDNYNEFDGWELGKMEEACWNGLLWEVLPELYLDAGTSKELVLWKIILADYFLDLEYGELLQRKDFSLSINPYLFLGPQLQS